MATQKKPAHKDELKIRIVGKSSDFVDVQSLLHVTHETLMILKEIDADIAKRDSGTLEWRVIAASVQSPFTMTLSPERHLAGAKYNGKHVIRQYMSGMQQIEHTSSYPSHYTNRALVGAKRLVSVLNNGVADLVFTSPLHEQIAPTGRVALHVDDILRNQPDVLFQHTSIEGRLEVISIHGGIRANIYSSRTGDKIDCSLKANQLDKALEAFGKRVCVFGRVKYTKQGKAVEIVPRSIRILEDTNLPTFGDLEGIDITDGVDPTEFVRRLRDAN